MLDGLQPPLAQLSIISAVRQTLSGWAKSNMFEAWCGIEKQVDEK